ncbi:MAG TPA: 3-dehydroquinate synthase [Chloroflexota bacterium]|nr:3-dehydroquinate synthase [Chloroflexota bacterium]
MFLIGLSGSGKSTVGPLLARQLALPFVDLDATIARTAGKSIPEIFRDEGEATFRELERAALARICARPASVVATGGGLPVDARNREAMRRAGDVIWLDAPISTLVERLSRAEDHGRPLLQDGAAEGLARLERDRRSLYAEVGARVGADCAPTEVVDRILVALRDGGASDPGGEATVNYPPASVVVRTPSQTYPIYVGDGLLERAAGLLRASGVDAPLHVVVDARVDALHGARLRAGLEGIRFTWHSIAGGEERKTLESVSCLYDALLAERPERGHVIVAFGGGVIGDLVGFVAATILRGVRFVQIPTTVLAQVDSSVGGKVGFDHPRGKNLIGAFHQPSLVLADREVLTTLPPREVAAGWAEVVKIAVVQDAAFFDEIERTSEKLRALEPHATVTAIRKAVQLKARLVEEDERDVTGARAILNYGHTIGHALEAATGYETLLHGEAVAIGMAAAAHIATTMGLHPPDATERQRQLLLGLGLPQSCEFAERADVHAALGLDKKRVGSRLAWILPAGLGRGRVTSDVPDELVERAIDLVTRPARLAQS